MGFQKGHKLATGRPTGAINKSTEETKRMVTELVERGMDKAFAMLNKIDDPKEYLDSISKFIAYVIPKKVHVEDKAAEELVKVLKIKLHGKRDRDSV